MTQLLIYDASTPPDPAPQSDGCMIYGGGDTPHVWTDEEIARQTCRFRLPAFVRSNPQDASPVVDATDFLQWLQSHSVPQHVATLLDLEIARAPDYVNQYGQIIHDGGYLVLVYGSLSSVFDNPELDGYFTAHPGAQEIDPNAVGTQFAYMGSYDLSWLLATVPLWDTKPSTGGQPVTNEHQHIGTVTLGGDGTGWADSGGVPGWDGSCPGGVMIFSGDPDVDNEPKFVRWSADGRLFFSGGKPGGPYGFMVTDPTPA